MTYWPNMVGLAAQKPVHSREIISRNFQTIVVNSVYPNEGNLNIISFVRLLKLIILVLIIIECTFSFDYEC